MSALWGYGGWGAQSEQQKMTMTFDDAIDAAMDLLRGSIVNYIICFMAILTCIGFTFVGFILMTNGSGSSCGMLIVTIFFLIAQAGTLAKTSRDFKLASVALKESTTAQSIEFQFLRPTRLQLFQVSLFMLLSITACIYSLTQVQLTDKHSAGTGSKSAEEWYGFAALAMLWVLDSTYCLTRAVHDRRDAIAWAKSEKESRVKQLKYVMGMCGGTLDYNFIVWLSFLASPVITMLCVWAVFSETELSVERKGLLSITLLYNIASTYHVVKLLRDRRQARRLKLSSTQSSSLQLPFQLMVTVNFLISVIVPIGCIIGMVRSTDHCFFLLTGFIMSTIATWNLANVVRDRHELAVLKERMPQGGGLEQARDLFRHPEQILQQADPLAMLKGQGAYAAHGQEAQHHAINMHGMHIPGLHQHQQLPPHQENKKEENPIWDGVTHGFQGLADALGGTRV